MSDHKACIRNLSGESDLVTTTKGKVASVALDFLKDHAGFKKCARSWRYADDVGSDPRYPDLSARDAAAVAEIDGRKAE